VQKETTKILQKLSELEKEGGGLPLLLVFYRGLLQIQASVEKRIIKPEPRITREVICQRIRKGQPILSFDNLALDHNLVQELFVEVIATFNSYPQLFGELPKKLLKPGAGRLLTKKAIRAWFTENELPATIQDGVGENLMSAIIHATLQPFLAGHSEVLKNTIDYENWRRGYCPICGGSPDFSYLDKERGSRYLLCSHCDTEWVFKRLECPFCGCQNPYALNYTTDDKGLYRLYTCRDCGRYLKAIDLRKTEEDILFPLERLLTIDMDRQVREKDFEK
jgi:FdhE protein